MFAKNQKLAYKVVRKMQITIPGYDQEDLYQVAKIGLWKACQTYDPTKAKLGTYAYTCIKRELLMARRAVVDKRRGMEEVSLQSISEQCDEGFDPYYHTPKTESFEDALLDVIDTENLNLTSEEKLILNLKQYFTEKEVERLCLVSKWQQRRIRAKARGRAH
jgi:RNA polymerase sigma factor (sigma-70 family)